MSDNENLNNETDNLNLNDEDQNVIGNEYDIPTDRGEDEDEPELTNDMMTNNDETPRAETEFVVLDPDHPLMKRFQKALNEMLTKQLERIEIEDKESAEELKYRKDNHIELGNELYGVQQDLAKQQADLERLQDNYQLVKQKKQETDELLSMIRAQFRQESGKVADESGKLQQLRKEMDSTALRVFYLKSAKKDVRGDIAVFKRAAEKAVEDLYKAESDKLQQDFLVDRIVEQVNRLEEEIGLYEAQIAAQSEEKKAVVDTLRDAQNEIVTIKSEQRKLMSRWHSTLIGLERRNEAYFTMNNGVKEKQDLILSLQSELEAHQKVTGKEQDKNEQLTLMLSKKQNDLAAIKKLLLQTQNKFMTLKTEYSAYARTLQETETNLARTNNDKNIRQGEVDNLRKAIEKENQKRIECEEKIAEELRSKLTMSKAADYVNKLKVQMRDKTRHLETQIVLLENKISIDSLACAKVISINKQLKKHLVELEVEIKEKNDTITKLNTETYRNNITVERNQGTVDQLNKKLEAMKASAGGVELGPLEININHLKKNIQVKEDEDNELEQQWLRYQQDLVKLYNQKAELINNVGLLKQKMTILLQRQIRIEGDIDKEKREKNEISRQLKNLQTDMVRLNKLIFQEKDCQEGLEKQTSLMEADFLRGLKAEELDSIQMKQRLMDIEEEKEKLLNDLVEAERQIMEWEKKIQLTQETREAVDSEVGQGEMKMMKCEIHRMEVRYQQLLRQQELLIQDMEKSVSRREVIATRGEALQKVKHKATTKGGVEREIMELKRKIKQTLKNAQECDNQIKYYETEREKICQEISNRKEITDELQHKLDSVTLLIDKSKRDKLSQIISLQQKQQKAKYLQQFKDQKYTRLCKTEETLDREIEVQSKKIESINTIVDRICRDYPQIQGEMGPILNLIQKKMEEVEDK